MAKSPVPDPSRLDRVVAEARRHSTEREDTYRERALKLYPWICGRCAREFSGVRLRELTVHHKDHNHDNNPLDGSNWELLCIYCHENEHARVADEAARASLTRRKGFAGGAGSDAVARYPQTGDFITNVSARRSPGGQGPVATHNPFADLQKKLEDKGTREAQQRKKS